MTPPLGFVLLTHRAPAQLARLVTRLRRTFGDVPIACHHDFGQTPFDRASVAPGVRFVERWLPTEWGRANVVEGMRRALALLYAEADAPRWFVVLTGSDYPVAPAPRVVSDLDALGADVALRAEPIAPEGAPPPLDAPLGFGPGRGPGYEKAQARFFRFQRTLPLGPLRWRVRWRPRGALGRRLVLPYGPALRCYAGDAVFSGTARAADVLLAMPERHPRLRAHYAALASADESWPQTVLCNDPTIRVSPRSFRYIDWRAGEGHPKVLEAHDVPAILDSGAHFARKFEPGVSDKALELLDAVLDASPAPRR